MLLEREGEDEILAADYHLPPAELDEEREEERDAKLPRRSNRTMMEGQGEGEARIRGSILRHNVESCRGTP